MIEITYQSTEEREQIIDEQTQAGHILTCEKNISGGNYLIFNTTSELMPEPTEIEVLRLEQAQSNVEMIDLIMAMLGGV